MDFQEGLEIGFFSSIILVAVLHGVFLASIFLFHQKLNAKPNKFLSLSIWGICVILAYEFVYGLELENFIPIWIQYLPLYIRTTIPVGIFYFVIFLIQPDRQLSNFEKIGFLLIGIEVLLDLAYIPTNLIIDDASTIEIVEYYIIVISWSLSILAAVIFIPFALYRVNSYQKFLLNHYSTTGGKSLSWLRNFLFLILFMMIFWIISFVQYTLEYWEAFSFTFGMVIIGLVLLLFWVGYTVILRYSWFEIVPFKEEAKTREANGTKLSAKTDAYHKDLLAMMQDKRLYEDPELTLEILSERLHISSGYLSQIINEKEGKNFFEFVNSYRVEAVKEKLLNKQYKHYTIMGVAMESGFNSKSTFNSVFKKFTNYTPSTFKKIHN